MDLRAISLTPCKVGHGSVEVLPRIPAVVLQRDAVVVHDEGLHHPVVPRRALDGPCSTYSCLGHG